MKAVFEKSAEMALEELAAVRRTFTAATSSDQRMKFAGACTRLCQAIQSREFTNPLEEKGEPDGGCGA